MSGWRSLLFVPGDRPERFAKAAASGADAIILDLEDSVVPERKPLAREAVSDWLRCERACPVFVRINPLASDDIGRDLTSLRPAKLDGLLLPKAEGAASVETLATLWGEGLPPVLPIATETPAAIFELGSYRECARRLAGLTWGAEDLPAAIGATTSREANGAFTPPYEMLRSMTLFAAHAARVPAIETVYPDITDLTGLAAYVARARRDGFTGMMAIHPAQVEVINHGFSPSDEEIAQARAVIEVFDSNPGAGAIRLDGRMVDAPHLAHARRVLALAKAKNEGRPG